MNRLNFASVPLPIFVLHGRASLSTLPHITPPRSRAGNVHHNQQLRLHGVAGHPLQRRRLATVHHRLRPSAGTVSSSHGRLGVVRTHLGPHAVRHGLLRQLHLRHRRLRLRRRRVLRPRRCPAGHTGRVHARRRHGRGRLLRRQPRRRLQRADARRAAGAVAGGGQRELPGHGLPRGPEQGVPGGPARGVRRRGRGGVPERVRGVRGGAVLLQRRVRVAGDVRADVVLAVLQGRVPALVQLRLRRRDVDVHLRGGRRRLRRRLLPHHVQPKTRRESRGSRTATLQSNNGVLGRRRQFDEEQERVPYHPDGRHHGDVDDAVLLISCKLSTSRMMWKENYFFPLGRRS